VIIGIAIGVVFMALLILAYAVGYGMASQKFNPQDDEQE
jgi:Na+-transporting methylmalonyl-CoA/oxaloacetate decarboxylase gamma subunit